MPRNADLTRATVGRPYPLFEAMCSASGLPSPEREHRFCPPRRWRFDFAWVERCVALEVEGGAYRGPGHRSVGKYLRDLAKYNEAAILGWRVLRCTTRDVRTGAACALVARAVLQGGAR